MLPTTVKDMFQTIELTDFKEARGYVPNQLGALENEREHKPATINLNANKEVTRNVNFEGPPAQEESNSIDERLCWKGKGP